MGVSSRRMNPLGMSSPISFNRDPIPAASIIALVIALIIQLHSYKSKRKEVIS